MSSEEITHYTRNGYPKVQVERKTDEGVTSTISDVMILGDVIISEENYDILVAANDVAIADLLSSMEDQIAQNKVDRDALRISAAAKLTALSGFSADELLMILN